MASDPTKFIDPDSCPDIPDFQWADPSKIRIGYVDQLWSFYYDRIQEMDEPITFVVENVDDDSSDQESTKKKKSRSNKKGKQIDKGKARERDSAAADKEDAVTTKNHRLRKENAQQQKAQKLKSSRLDQEPEEEDFTEAINDVPMDTEDDDGSAEPTVVKQGPVKGHGGSPSQHNSLQVHPNSPAAWTTPADRMPFLWTLSKEKSYVALVECLSNAPVRLQFHYCFGF